MGWSAKPGEQTFELPTYPTTVVQNEPDMSEAQPQLQHAKEELDVTGQYTGRRLSPHNRRWATSTSRL
jgi:hypothetical protein